MLLISWLVGAGTLELVIIFVESKDPRVMWLLC